MFEANDHAPVYVEIDFATASATVIWVKDGSLMKLAFDGDTGASVTECILEETPCERAPLDGCSILANVHAS